MGLRGLEGRSKRKRYALEGGRGDNRGKSRARYKLRFLNVLVGLGLLVLASGWNF